MVDFEKVKKFEKEEIRLPERSTAHSAGYDFFAIEDIKLPAKQLTRIMTGVKCRLLPDMILMLANRSSNPSKKGLILANGVGIVDSDYYGNESNDGEIGFEFYNMSEQEVEIKKGEKIGQGVILHYILTDNDYVSNLNNTRTGGFGSTGK